MSDSGRFPQRDGFGTSVEPTVEPAQANDHFALIYEDRAEQFAAVVPFIRRGLDRGERCLYVVDENTEEAVLDAMRSGGIDVDAALESGALSVYTEAETYHRTGEFDREAMVDFWERSLDQATADGYTGIRAAAEMTWALDGDTGLDLLAEYEAVLNDVYQGEDYAVLCQYNRNRFPPDLIHDVVRTHPLVVHDGVVNTNVYYSPPEEFLGPDRTESYLDRLLDALDERTETHRALRQREAHFQQVFENSHDAILIVDPEADRIIDANPAASEMLGYSRDQLLQLGPSDIHADDLDRFRSFVRGVYEDGTGWTDELTCRTKDRGRIPAELSASVMDHDDRSVMLASVRDISERKARERSQRRLYEITADADRTFEERLDAVIELGCERFGMPLGGLAKVDPEADTFEVEVINREHSHLVPGQQYPLSETYCRAVAGNGDTAAITDPVDAGFEGKLCYDRFGVRAYLGTYLELEGAPDRTFFFVSNEPRQEPVSDADRTFHHLMGQWVRYELERREREREVRERTEQLSTIIETAPDCIKTVAEDGTVLEMNPAGLALAEADAESDVIGGCIYDFVAPDHRDRYRAFNERICQGERDTLEFDVISLEGTRRRLKSHAAPLHRPDGTTVQVSVTRDVTEQLARERELERALDLLEKTERIADVGGWEIDVESEEVFWTDQIFELLEWPGDEEPPLEEALDVYLEEDRPVIEGAVEEALGSGEPFDVEARYRTAGGEIRWFRVQGLADTRGGEVVSLRGAAQDITERKEREERLREVIDRLEASNDRLEQFAYAASHDLQEPLRMVSTYLRLLEDRHADELDEEAAEYLQYAVDGADRMRAMVDDLLAFSRVEQADGTYERVDCEALLERVQDALQIQIEEADAEIIVEPLPPVLADGEQLEQLFLNLVSNAIKYCGEDPPRVEIAAEQRADEWEFTVRDNGIGIEPDKTDRIFEVFKRLHHDDEYPGTGIGLSLSQEIVENHGGDIWVEPEPGEGSTFHFTIPIAEQR